MALGCWLCRAPSTSECILGELAEKYDYGPGTRMEEFCEVFQVKEKATGHSFSCKRFRKRDGRRVREIARNEAHMLKMIKHPNVLQLVDSFETRTEYILITEYATGKEVFEWLLELGRYSEQDASVVLHQVLTAVSHLHSLGIVHRDLKLETLMYHTRNGDTNIVLTDFHLAKMEGRRIREPCGTPEYLEGSSNKLCRLLFSAPEVVAKKKYGRPVDCWAVGVIMYILLSGNPPFYVECDDHANHDKSLYRQILAGNYEFDSPYWDEISDAAKDLVSKLLEVNQEHRMTAKEALAHEWTCGKAALDKDIKSGVCAQMKRNFAKRRWKKAFQVTTVVKHLMGNQRGTNERKRRTDVEMETEGETRSTDEEEAVGPEQKSQMSGLEEEEEKVCTKNQH
uniref:caM kinase-like vesicle-associated protein isoform X1 n=2 Tax=Myxine glutinosa TaxID=7769 RepID=UPI00358E9C71